MPPLLADTDVMIDYLRGQPDAIAYLQAQQGTLLLSAVTVAELYGGVREGVERQVLETLLSVFTIVPVTAEIAAQGGLFWRDYRKSHGMGLPDALIAATAAASGATLVTLNVRHFPMLAALVPYRKS